MTLLKIHFDASLPSPSTGAGCALSWRKSTRSGKSGCVEVARSSQHVFVRDSTSPRGPVIAFATQQWRRFTQAVKDGSLSAATRTS
ncbi:DUF397 domain-containing protein [Phytohabitans suffuscus]|uniref:DUF397 domain-containing protein n=1 Tax=Phytohabitans suffuscus TaxID=624315 RepID=UPI001566DFFA